MAIGRLGRSSGVSRWAQARLVVKRTPRGTIAWELIVRRSDGNSYRDQFEKAGELHYEPGDEVSAEAWEAVLAALAEWLLTRESGSSASPTGGPQGDVLRGLDPLTYVLE